MSDGSGQMQTYSVPIMLTGGISAVYQPLYQQPLPWGKSPPCRTADSLTFSWSSKLKFIWC